MTHLPAMNKPDSTDTPAAQSASTTALSTNRTAASPVRMLLEMRPALDGFAGIPQESRLLFRGLCELPGFRVEGLLQASLRQLANGVSTRGVMSNWMRSEARLMNRYSRVVISVAERPFYSRLDKLMNMAWRRIDSAYLAIQSALGIGRIPLTEFRSQHFEDFVWRQIFAKTLPAADRKLVSRHDLRVCAPSWHTMHLAGLKTLSILPSPRYPRVDSRGVDIVLTQTPYPGRFEAGTKMVVRYHDAIPVFMPHTIPDKSIHQATHFYALMANVRQGAWFACVSEATRNELLRLHPQAESKSVVIHNMVSQHYHPAPADFELVPGIIRARLYEGDMGKKAPLEPTFLSLRERESFYRKHLGQRPFRFLLIVSTIEPRKNHSRLLAAWEVLKAEVDPDLKLVIVGTLGWDIQQLARSFKSWIDRGDLFCLHQVPAPDLRVLYQHAAATVCPSLGEGFDYSGIESMRSGGVAIASDIEVHREVYADAADYFDPYSTASLVSSLKRVIYDADSGAYSERLRQAGGFLAKRYLPEAILPRWQRFLECVRADRPMSDPVPAYLRDDGVTPEQIRQAYLDILGREPESQIAIDAHRGLSDEQALRRTLMACAEFRASSRGEGDAHPPSAAGASLSSAKPAVSESRVSAPAEIA
ncbi:MAG: glycosyltransferase family 1 protein [Burkholderiaceae bacterium]